MNNRLLLPLICLITISLFSCKKELTSADGKTKSNRLAINEFDFEYLRGKGKIDYLEKNERQNARVNIRMKKDSVIWVQLSGVGGIEGGRIMITKDSLTMIDRINKVFYSYGYKDLSDRYKFDINFELLQSMLIGNMPFKQQNRDRITRQNDYFLVRQKEDLYTVDNYISRVNQKLEKLTIEQIATRNTLNLNYAEFSLVNDILFPYNSSMSLKYNNGNKTLFTEMTLEFNRAEIPEKPLKFPFAIPQKYERQ